MGNLTFRVHAALDVYDAWALRSSTRVSAVESASPTPPAPAIRPGLVAALAAGGVLVSLAQTLIIPLITQLPQIFNTSAANASWIITVTLLAGAVSTPVTGRLADMYGKKLMLLLALAAFIVGALLSAAAPGLGVMIAGRAMQGVAAGLIPLGISLMHDLLPRERAGKAIALMSASMGIGGSLGLPLAAAVAQFANWRILFLSVALVAALIAAALMWAIPDVRGSSRDSGAFDAIGALGLTAGLVALLLAISKGSDWGWTSAATLGNAAGAVVVLSLWGLHQARKRNPLVNLRTAAIPAVLLTNLASILIGFTMYAMNLLLPPVIQLPVDLGYGLGQSMVAMGLWIFPMGIGMVAVSNLGAAISRKHSPRVTLIAAGLVAATGYGSAFGVLATIGNRAPGPADDGTIALTLILISLASAIIGAGIALALGAIPALILSVVPLTETAAANGLNALMRSLGTTSAAAVLGVILASLTHSSGGLAVPTLGGYLTGLGLTTGIALVASAVAAFIPRR